MIWSLFRRPKAFAATPRLKRYTVALKEAVHRDLTTPWRGEHLMTIAATDPEDAKKRALDECARYGVVLGDNDVIAVRGGERNA